MCKCQCCGLLRKSRWRIHIKFKLCTSIVALLFLDWVVHQRHNLKRHTTPNPKKGNTEVYSKHCNLNYHFVINFSLILNWWKELNQFSRLFQLCTNELSRQVFSHINLGQIIHILNKKSNKNINNNTWKSVDHRN